MLHGPCGVANKKSPCMVQNRCSKYFPKRTTTDEDSGNVVDEINMYYDCRYISACEATWRIFGYDIHLRTPPVERLSFHLENEQSVFFYDEEPLDDVLKRETISQSMFTAWFNVNKIFEDARCLTYAEMPSRFVWNRGLRQWRKQGFSIGRMFYVPPGSGEIFYLRCLLNLVRGPTSYDDIRTVAGEIYKTFRDACYARGLLDDDREYVDAITESSFWATAFALRRLFVTLLTSNSISRPEVVWNAVWEHLCDDAQRHRRRMLRDQDAVLTNDEKKQFALGQSESGPDNLSDAYTPEFLNGLRCSRVPNHALTLKVGSPVMLLRNIDHSLSLCNGTRLIITHRLTTFWKQRSWLVDTQRRQFPLMLAYAMTINKSQGQTLSHVGLLLKKPVFNHGQLYVAFSRVSHPKGLKILILDDAGQPCNSTTNVVYKEVFNNL